MRLSLLAVLALAALVASPATALELGGTVLVDGQLRIALVIGQGAVGETPTRAGSDAEDMADALTAVGFSVDRVGDAGAADLTAAIADFADRAASADIAFIIYAGPVLEGPDGALLAAPAEAGDETPPTPRDLADAASLAGSLGVVLIDAPWPNPFGADSALGDLPTGIGPLRGLTPGVVVIAATANPPMPASARSPFARAVVAMTGEAGMDLSAALLQASARVAEETNRGVVISLFGRAQLDQFYFMPPQPEEELASATEQIFWDSVSDSDDPADYQAYLDVYPDGVYAALAQNRIETLTGDTEPTVTEPIEVAETPPDETSEEPPDGNEEPQVALRQPNLIDPQLLPVADRISIQEDLFRLGLYRSGIDGIFGPGTRRAISAFQRTLREPETGELTQAQRQQLRIAANAVPQTDPVTPPEPTIPEPTVPETTTGLREPVVTPPEPTQTAALPPPRVRRYAAVAVSSPAGSWGFCSDQDSEFGARRCAQSQCGPVCRVPVIIASGQCAAYAESRTLNVVAAAAAGASADQASGQALAQCNADTPFSDCRVRDVRCQE